VKRDWFKKTKADLFFNNIPVNVKKLSLLDKIFFSPCFVILNTFDEVGPLIADQLFNSTRV
jgi:hypothetical protein